MTYLLTFPDSFSNIYCRYAGRRLHRNGNQDHPSNTLVVGLDDYHLSRGNAAEKGLLSLIFAHAGLLGAGFQHEEETRDSVDVLHNSTYGCMPAMIAESIQEYLEDGATDKLLSH